MRPSRETKEEKFRRLAEARVNKILHLLRLLGNLSWTGTYAYTREQVEQIFEVKDHVAGGGEGTKAQLFFETDGGGFDVFLGRHAIHSLSK